MKTAGNLLFALTVAFLMTATFVPAGPFCSDGDGVSSGPQLSDGDKKVSLIDGGDGSFVMSVPFLEDRFGYKPHTPDPEDPSLGVLGIDIKEVHTYYGTSENNRIFDVDGYLRTYEPLADGPVITNGVSRGTEFSAAFSNNYLETGVEDIFTYGITVDGVWFLQNTTNTDAHFKDLSDTANAQYLGHLLTEYEKVGMYQSSNLFPYAVGDFVEDPPGRETEEIAVYLGNTVDIYDCVDEDDHMWPVKSIPIPDDSYGHGYTVNPVSMAAGDTDGDGMDEIILTVEYSSDYSSPEDCCAADHCTMLYLLEHGDWVLSERLYTEVYNEYYGTTEHLDTVMVSVYATDYDFDMKDEIVVGGYLWDNGNNSHKICQDPNYFCGEQFLSNIDPNDGDLTMNNLKRLMDDAMDDDPDNPKYERTPYDLPATNGFFSVGRDYKDHYEADTSIMLEDWSDNQFGYCRSPNWTNWTMPMAAVHLKSLAESPYVYFDYCIYTLNEEGEYGFECDVVVNHYQDNNNCQCTHIDVGAMSYREDYRYLSYEDLFRAMAMDCQERDTGGDMFLMAEMVRMTGGEIENKHVSGLVPVEWTDYEPFMACLLSWSPHNDIDVEYAGVVATTLEPTVLAAISGIPYDSDLADCLGSGSQDIGRTVYFNSRAVSSEDGGSFHVMLDSAGGIDNLLTDIQVDSGYDFRVGWSKTTTTKITNEFSSSENSVALYLMPVDVYTYLVTRMDGDRVVQEQEDLIRIYDPLMITLPYRSYCELIDQYDESMKEFYGAFSIFYDDLDKISFGHKKGDISSFVEEPGENVLAEVSAQYSGDGPSGTNGSTVEFADAISAEDMFGKNLNIRAVGKLPLRINMGVEAAVDGGEVHTHTNVAGMGFKTELAAGLADSYCWEDEDAAVVTAQYGMYGSMWATEESVNGSPYVYLGYTVGTSTSACKNGWLAPNTYVIDEDTDDSDPRNPTEDSFYMKVFVPGDVRPDLLADSYEIQMLYQERWYGWRDTAEDLGLTYQVETGETDAQGRPVLVPLTDDFRPAVDSGGNTVDSAYWVKVSGLKDFKSSTFDFRLMGYDPDGNPHPAIRTTCCTEDRVLTESLKVIKDFRVFENNIVLPWIDGIHEGALLVIKTDLAPGSLVDVYYQTEDGGFAYHGKETVSMDGRVMADILGGPKDTDEPVPAAVTLLVFAGILVLLFCGARVIRRS